MSYDGDKRRLSILRAIYYTFYKYIFRVNIIIFIVYNYYIIPAYLSINLYYYCNH